MVHSCSAYNCTQRFQLGVSFHKFPNDTLLLKKWLIAMRREKWIPSKSSKICSRHFTDDSYETSPWATQRRLKPNAVPSIFNFPEHLQKPNKSRPSPRKRTHESTTSNESIETAAISVTDSIGQLPHKRRCFLGDFTKEDLNSEIYSDL